MLTHHL